MIIRTRTKGFLRLAVAFCLLVLAAPAAGDGWQPTKPVEWIVMGPEGGRVDRFARTLARVVTELGGLPQPLAVTNRRQGFPGDPLEHLKNREGDPHFIVLTSAAYLTMPLLNPSLGVDIQSFTPIAGMADDSLQFWVRRDRAEKTVGQMAAVQFDTGGDPTRIGFRHDDDEDWLALKALEKGVALKLAPVRYRSSRGAPKDLVRGFLDGAIATPGEAGGFWATERVRPMTNFSPLEPPGTGTGVVPPIRVAETDVAALALPRAIVAPGRISVEAQSFYEKLFHAVDSSEPWRQYLADHRLVPAWTAGLELTKKLVAAREGYRKFLKDLGEIE